MTTENLNAVGVYHVECIDKNGVVRWTETNKNIIPYQGKDSLLANYFTGSSWTPTFYMSLITAGTASLTSTYASPGVTEVTNAIITARLPVAWGSPASGAIAATTTSFSITGSATITGNLVVIGGTAAATVGDTAGGGALFSSSNFNGGGQAVLSGDTINIVYSVSV